MAESSQPLFQSYREWKHSEKYIVKKHGSNFDFVASAGPFLDWKDKRTW